MTMGILWTGMVAAALVCGAVNGRLTAVTAAALEGAGAAVELTLAMAGALCLWSGVLEVMARSGMADGLSRLLRPVLRRLLPRAGDDSETLAALSANVSANLLGLGNAATPAGIRAAQRMAQGYQQGEHTFTLYEGGRFHLLTYREDGAMDAVYPQASRAYKGLDVAILHALLLERLLGIDQANMKNQVNLTYTRSLEEAIGTVDQQHANCAVLLNPTKVEEIRDVALAGEKMPQKSTYFYPKLITGLVMNKMVD